MRAGLSRVEWPTDWIFRSSQISCIWRATAKAVSLGRTRAGARWPEDRQAQARRSPAAPRQWRSLADYSVMLPARRQLRLQYGHLGCGVPPTLGAAAAVNGLARVNDRHAGGTSSAAGGLALGVGQGVSPLDLRGMVLHSARDVTKPRAHRSLGCSPGDALPARRKHQCRRATHE